MSLTNLEEEKSQPKKGFHIMCGRFVVFSNLEQLKQHFHIDKALSEFTPNYNVAPTQEILAIFLQDGLNVLEKLHWGLVPHWAKDISTGYKMINARSETIATKPSFRDAIKKRRCLILADGFYEWSGSKGNKQPVFIILPDKKPFAFAGLSETWHDKDHQEAPYRSCAIITREASLCAWKISITACQLFCIRTHMMLGWTKETRTEKGYRKFWLKERLPSSNSDRYPGRLGFFDYVLKFLFQPGNPIIILYESVIITTAAEIGLTMVVTPRYCVLNHVVEYHMLKFPGRSLN
jgi:hypothetical protein